MEERILTPQQIEFLRGYTDPNSETFGNATQSAINAKYTREYAENITSLMPEWLSENIGDLKMLRKAEKNLNNALDIDVKDEKLGDRGLRATMFVAERLGRKRYGQKIDLEATITKKLIKVDE